MKKYLNKVALLVVALVSIVSFVSCSTEAEKRVEIAKIVESRGAKDLLNDLYIGSDGDVESLARILGATPSSIERIRTGATKATVEFEERIKDVSIYYSLNGQSFSKLRAAIDSEWAWYDSVLHWPSHKPVVFWAINIILLLLLAFIALVAIWPILAEMLLFLIVWLCSIIFSPSNMEDKYVDTINPVLEQIL